MGNTLLRMQATKPPPTNQPSDLITIKWTLDIRKTDDLQVPHRITAIGDYTKDTFLDGKYFRILSV
jgi:hypothetical protein